MGQLVVIYVVMALRFVPPGAHPVGSPSVPGGFTPVGILMPALGCLVAKRSERV
jgi:hypothetical protein